MTTKARQDQLLGILRPARHLGPSTIVDRWRLSRRSFLGAAACTIGAVGCADQPGTADCPTRPGFGAPPPNYEPQMPFALSSQSVLSEDYFEVTNHKIDVDNGDKVVAYTRVNGDTEAVVLQDGVVKLVYRDPSQAGGWAVFALPDAIGVADMVAAVGQASLGSISSAAYLQICYLRKDKPDTLVVASQPAGPIGAEGPTFTTTTVAWNAKAGPLAITMGSRGILHGLEPLVSAMVQDSAEGVRDAKLCWHFGENSSGILTGFSFNPWDGDRSWSLSVLGSKYTDLTAGGFVLDIAKADGSLELWSLTGLAGGAMAKLDVPSPRPPEDASGLRTVVSDVVALFALKYSSLAALPAALVWTQHEVPVEGGLIGAPQLWMVTFNGDTGAPDWTWTSLAVAAGEDAQFDIPVTTALTPRAAPGAGYLVDVFVTWDGTLRVVRQIEQDVRTDEHAPLFTPLIPLQPEVRAMSSQAAPSAGNQLIVVGDDGTLQTLVKDPVSGAWTDSVMHLPASELQELSSYRVTLTLADAAWNAPVGSHDVTITASTPAVAVIEGPSPRTVLLGALPVTVTTDGNGEIQLALLAEGLAAPTLTIVASGLPTPAKVYPSEPINTYMQGNGTLNFLPVMSGATLTGAKTPDGRTVAPGAADASTADEAATAMKQAADLASQGALLGATASTISRVDGASRMGAEALRSSIDHWAQDVFHAIKKGAAAVQHVTVDIEKKIVTIAIDVADWVDNAVQIVVNTIEDAAHVLHAVFNQLKADIVAAVKWLRALVKSLLQDSARVAEEFMVLIKQATDFLGDRSDSVKAAVDSWFVGKEKEIQASFDRLRKGYPGKATFGTISDFNPAKSALAADAQPEADDEDAPQPHGAWFLNKVKHAIYGELDTPQFTGISYDKLQLDVIEACASEVGALESAAQEFWLFVKTAVTHPSDLAAVVVPAFLEAVSKLIQAALRLLNAVLDALFSMIAALSKAIPDMLGTKIGKAGIVGKLLSLAGLGDFEIGTIAAMVFAFPATLAYKIVNGPDTRPFSYVANEAKLGADPGVDRSLQLTASAVMGTWAELDVINFLLTIDSKDGTGGVPMLTPAVDLVGPILVGALAPPFIKDGLPDWRLIDPNSDMELAAFTSWLLDIMPAFCSAQTIYAKKSKVAEVKETENAAIWLQTAFGVASLAAGVRAAEDDPEANGVDFAIPILNNIPNIMACLNSTLIKEATEQTSVAVGAIASLFGGGAGAVLYGA